MTNWETFIVVMVTLLPFLLMIGAVVWGGINSSKETYQVLYKPATFTNSPWRHFVSIDMVISLTFLVTGYTMSKLLLINGVTSSALPMWLTYLFLSGIIILFLFLGVHVFILTINYWTYTQDISIQFEPNSKTIYVGSGTHEYVLKEDSIESIDLFSNEAKMSFGYWQFKLKNGEQFVLTDRTRGVYGIFEYFKKVPITTHKTFFPFIH